MSTKKYIIDNKADQAITGNISISGDLDISGTINGKAIYKTYTALLTETTSLIGDSIIYFDHALIVGETYNILSYSSGDDFSNIANVISGTANETGCEFVATGKFPTAWGEGTIISSNGGLVVSELENTLGFDVEWVQAGNGVYAAYDPLEVASFTREKTAVSVGIKANFYGDKFVTPFYEIISQGYDDDAIILTMISFMDGQASAGALYLTPFTINMYP